MSNKLELVITEFRTQGEVCVSGKFPISGMEHDSPQSFVQFFSRTNKPQDLILCSNGDLQIKSDISEILGDEPLVLTNIRNTDFIKFTRAKFLNKPLHNVLALASFILSIVFLGNSELIVDFLFVDLDLTIFEQFSIFVAPFLIILFDHLRLGMIQVSQLILDFEDSEKIVFNGDAPDSALFFISKMFLLFGLFIPMMLFLEWIIQQAPRIGDFFACIIGLMILYVFLKGTYSLFFKPDSVNPEETDDFILGYQHMYFAMMMVKNTEAFTGTKSEEVTLAINGFGKELLQYKDNLKNLNTLDEIISASNPSMGVLAIGISTEILMRHICELAGISFKPSARPTLDPLIKQYNREKGIDSKTKSYLEVIKEMRNRAAHDFNIDWDEFKMVTQQFCQVVKWYTEQIESNQIPSQVIGKFGETEE